MAKQRRLLMVTDHRVISAVLFHGFGLPPWYDLPEVQTDPEYRKAMTARVNEVVELGRQAGFGAFDVHEAFPVDFMDMSESVRILRGCDRLMTERGYVGAAFLRGSFKGLKRQPRLRCVRRMTLGKLPIDETDLLAWFLAAQGVPVVYSEVRSKAVVSNSRRRFVADACDRQAFPRHGETLTIEMSSSVSLDRADYYPGVTTAGSHRMQAETRTATRALEIYRYAGLLVQATGNFKADRYK